MGVRHKICEDCGRRKRIGRSKSRCKACRKADPDKFRNRPARRHAKGHTKNYAQEPNARNAYSTVCLGKKQRDAVIRALGFETYQAYLRSPLWHSIRRRVLKGNRPCACGCGKPADQVHHKAYTEANLRGITLRGLVPINHQCHYAIEFSPEGRKVSLGQANHALKRRKTPECITFEDWLKEWVEKSGLN